MAVSREKSLLKLIVIIPVTIVLIASAMFITISVSIGKVNLNNELQIIEHINTLDSDINTSIYTQNIRYNEKINMDLMVITAIVVFIILLISMIKFASTFKRILKEYKKEINEFNEQKAKRSLLLSQKSKLSSMEEMISSIAHQWRQPLNSLGISIQNLEFDFNDKLITEKYIKDYVNINMDLINFMSHTIDDFRNLLKKDKIKQTFSIKQAIEKVLLLQDNNFEENNIKVKITGVDFSINGYKNEFKQVILNLVSNAKEILITKEQQSKEISISLNRKEKLIDIEDNGGGIQEDIIERVFEPYFTTKGEGSGIGLYMSKIIIENNMNGFLWVINTKKGAKFTISFADKFGEVK